MKNTPIDWNKKIEYRTKNDTYSEVCPARVICMDMLAPYPVVVLVKRTPAFEENHFFNRDGLECANGIQRIFNVPERVELTKYVNIYKELSGGYSSSGLYDNQAAAQNGALSCCIKAAYPVTISFLVGEGSNPKPHANTPDRIERTVWLNIYPGNSAACYPTRQEADLCAFKNRMACVEKQLSCLVGEGLERPQ